jgi:hypothetical protein
VKLFGKFGENPGEKIFVPAELKEVLWVRKIIASIQIGLPLGEIFAEPPLFLLYFVLDAAGTTLEWIQRVRKIVTIPRDRGVASAGFTGQTMDSLGIMKWLRTLVARDKSREGKFFGTKNRTLEIAGLLIPILTRPADLEGQHQCGVCLAKMKQQKKTQKCLF